MACRSIDFQSELTSHALNPFSKERENERGRFDSSLRGRRRVEDQFRGLSEGQVMS